LCVCVCVLCCNTVAVRLSVYLSACLSVSLSTYLSIYLSIYGRTVRRNIRRIYCASGIEFSQLLLMLHVTDMLLARYFVTLTFVFCYYSFTIMMCDFGSHKRNTMELSHVQHTITLYFFNLLLYRASVMDRFKTKHVVKANITIM
jgi:hypothetical protein